VNVAGVARARARVVRNTLLPRRGRPGRGGRHPLLAAVLALLVAVLVGAALSALFETLAGAGATAAGAAGTLALVLLASLAGLLVFDLHDAVSTLLLDPDLELLRRAPVPGIALLGLKLADALPRTSLLLVVVAIPAVVAFGLHYPLPAWGWITLPLQLAALWAIPLGAGTAAALYLLRRLPARRAREALGLISTLTLVALWLANAFLLPRLAEPGPGLAPALDGGRDGLALLAAVSPAHWLANAVAAATAGQPLAAAVATAWLIVVAAAAVALAAWTGARHLGEVQARLAAAPAGRGRAPRATRSARRPRTMLGALLLRDARLLLRDWTVLGDVLTAAVLWTLLPVVGATLHAAPPALLARAMLLALTVGLGYEVAARALPFEREAAAWQRLAPVPVGRWIAAKLIGASAVAAPLMGLAAGTLALVFPLPAGTWPRLVSLALSALWLSIALGVWTGARFGDPTWTSPRAMLTLAGRISASGLLLAQAAIWFWLSALADIREAALPAGIGLWGPPLVGSLVSLLPIRAAMGRLSKLES